MKMIISTALSVILAVGAVNCRSVNTKEQELLNFPGEEKPTFEQYLIRLDQYTTNGARYHKKYNNHLLGVARSIILNYSLKIKHYSLGFYYDRKQNRKDQLYLGLDIAIPLDNNLQNSSYQQIATAIMETHLKDILLVLNACTSVFRENEIVGMVIGFQWDSTARSETMSIWIEKGDVLKFLNRKLTRKELVARAFITNTSGRIIKIPL